MSKLTQKISFDGAGKNVDEELIYIFNLLYRRQTDIGVEHLEKLINTLCTRILMLNGLINESSEDLVQIEQFAKNNDIESIKNFLGVENNEIHETFRKSDDVRVSGDRSDC